MTAHDLHRMTNDQRDRVRQVIEDLRNLSKEGNTK